MAETMSEIMNPALSIRDANFPYAPLGWKKAEAESSAKSDGLNVIDDVLEVVRALQEYFKKAEEPNVRELHDALDEKFHSKGGLAYLYQIMPGGPVTQGCVLAGLDIPAGCVDPAEGSVE